MNENQFEQKYWEKGGMQRLISFFNDGETNANIARYFGVTRYCVGLWNKHFFGGVNSREIRKSKIINRLYLEATLIGEREFKKKYPKLNRSYKNIILSKLKDKNVCQQTSTQ